MDLCTLHIVHEFSHSLCGFSSCLSVVEAHFCLGISSPQLGCAPQRQCKCPQLNLIFSKSTPCVEYISITANQLLCQMLSSAIYPFSLALSPCRWSLHSPTFSSWWTQVPLPSLHPYYCCLAQSHHLSPVARAFSVVFLLRFVCLKSFFHTATSF